MKKIGIIGAGISGISLAKMLQDCAVATVFEKNNKIGGLIQCDRINGYLFHRVGGHIFNAKNKDIVNWFWSFFDREKEFLSAGRNAKVYLNGDIIGYPIEDHLFQLDAAILKRVLDELLIKKADKEYTDFESFLKANFGATLYEIYFKPYNEKIWGTNLATIPLPWLEGKLPMPQVNEILFNNILRKQESAMIHSFFYYPKNNGSQFIIDRLAEGIHLQTNFEVNNIICTSNGLFINNDGPYHKVVYTGDVRNLAGCFNDDSIISAEFNKKIGNLKSNGTTTVLCTCDENDLSWLYIPEKKFKAHRIIYTGNFSSTNNLANSKSSCTVEFSNLVSEEEVKAELQHLPGNLEFVAYNYQPDSYIVHNHETRELIKAYREKLAAKGIYLLGRFAEWEYYNMDKAMEAAYLLKAELIK